MKIAIVGGHGVGKTTLCQALAEHAEDLGERHALIGEVVRGCPYPINDGMCEQTAIWTICRQISLELEAEAKKISYIICDRSIFDPVLYLTHTLREREQSLSPEMLVVERLAMDWLRTYDKIVLVKGFCSSNLKNDGVRSQDVRFGVDMDNLFQHAFSDSTMVVQSDDIFSCRISCICKTLF